MRGSTRPIVALPLVAAIALGLASTGAAAPAVGTDDIVSTAPSAAEQESPSPSNTLPIATPCIPIPNPCPSSTPSSGSPSPTASGSPTPTLPGGGGGADCPKKSGHTLQFCFEVGVDYAGWWWKDQHYQVVQIGPLNFPVKLPSPQDSDTLPQAFQESELYKFSAMHFDVVRHGVPAGAKITKFIVTIEEGSTPVRDQPEYNTDGKVLLACPTSAIWAKAEAEVWKVRPKYRSSSCVNGVSKTKGTTSQWVFDLSAMAKKWASSPYTNYGFAIVPKEAGSGPQDENYQINLKFPERDDPTTAAVNEYDQTKGRTVVSVTYAKSTKPTTAPTTPVTTGGTAPSPVGSTSTGYYPSTSAGGGGVTGGTTGGGVGGFPSTTGGGTGVTGGSNPPVAPTTGASATGGPQAVVQKPVGTIPTVKFPWYVWVLLPIGLLALAAVRSILFEQAYGGIRPDGVIAAIRNRNAAARGATGQGPQSFLARARNIAREGLSKGGKS